MGSPETKRLPFSFWPLNIAQFLGAMNDNAYRWVMAWALATRASVATKSGTGEAVVQVNETALFIAGAVFAVPFILFSSAAGVLADRLSKRKIIVIVNFVAVVVMALGLAAFMSDNPFLIYAVLFLMAAQSAFFGPSKMGILPELVPPEKLSFANGLMESFTFLAIILGTVGGGWLYKTYGTDVAGASTFTCWRASVACTAVAAAGFLLSFLVKDTGARAAEKRATPYFWKDVARNIRSCRHDRYLLLSLFAIAFFLFLGSFVQLNVAPYGTNVMGLDKAAATNLFLALALGIGVGSFLAGKISGRTVEIGLVPLGVLLVSGMLMLLAFPFHRMSALASVTLRLGVGEHSFVASLPTLLTVLVVSLLGVGGGFYIVPLQTFLQQHAPKRDRGELIATSSFLSFCGVGLASALLLGLNALGLGPAGRFFLFGLATIALSVYVVRILPDFLIRFIGLVATRILCRVEVVGAENVPIEGGALLVCNHASHSDPAFLMATQQRRIRFIMHRDFYESRRFNWLFRIMKAVPISESDRPKEILRSLRDARRALDDGYLVCIFAEGSLTRTGFTMEFKEGFERIVKGSSHPVIPVNLHGVWGSILSYAKRAETPLGKGVTLRGFRDAILMYGRVHLLEGAPRRRVTVSFGKPLRSDASAFQVRQAVMELHSEAYGRDSRCHRNLAAEFAGVARAYWRHPCMADTTGKELTYGHTLTGALVLASILRRRLEGDRRVGVLMPTSVAGALVNLALAFLGKVSVNLNYTASTEAIRSAIQQSDARHTVTSRAFLGKLGPGPLQDLPGPLYIEDLQREATAGRRVRAFMRACFLPAPLLVDRQAGGRRDGGGARPGPHDTATIIFSSGSTGEPKGVELAHYNVIANARACGDVFPIGPQTVFCGILPFFHSFGYTATFWLPLLAGTSAAYHHSPLEAEQVGKLVAERKCTIFPSTPTFLLAYIRRVKPEQFASLELVITGAEKLNDRIAAAFEKRFGIRPMEGYGTTELSPVASVNLPNVEIAGVLQEANKPGTIGRPIPGVTMKVVDPEDLARDLGCDREGMLLVKGPNVMRGYLGKPEKTAEAIRDGWYVTGDVARLDHEGFATITDRLSRFSKIGGEMVPHLAIEEKIHECLGAMGQLCAVTALPDERKGERIVLVMTPEAGEPEKVHQMLKETGLPNLWIPAPKNILVVDALPALGSGKLDLRGLKNLAQSRLG
jgi:acyl-[acyl-carrier-protein]-phospholipid O-acyltransferase/long-chain-fatty-acid--[acyl-carrier-protein] ligase